MPIFYKKRRKYKYTLEKSHECQININTGKNIDTDYMKMSESGN